VQEFHSEEWRGRRWMERGKAQPGAENLTSVLTLDGASNNGTFKRGKDA